MGGGTTQQSGTSTSVNQIPQWMSNAGQQNYGFAQQVAEQPLQQYQGQMVADTAPQTQQSWNVAANSGNVGADQYQAGTAGYLGALGQTPANVTAGQLSNTNLQPYMNPYTQDVINATLPLMQQQNALSQNQQANAANSSNAFGGSRQGIQQGVAQAQGALNIGQMASQLNQANFAQAQAGATGDLQRTLAAQQGNQQAQQAKINSDIAASQGLTTTGDAMNRANVANYNMLQSAGAGQSMQAQNEINAQMAKFNQAFNYPQQQLGTLLSALGMTPHDTSTSGQTTQQTTTPTDWASIIKGGADVAGSLFPMGLSSDKTMKTDITKLGKDPKTGLEMHAFRYKGDPKSYPKVVGPMAQDVQKIAPDAVTPMGKDGKLAIRGYAGGTSNVQAMSDANKNAYDAERRRLAYGADPSRGLHQTPDEAAAYDAEMDRIIKSGSVPGYGPVQGYAGGTPFVQPSLAAFVPKSSPGVATGIGALSAFRPPMKLPRGAAIPKMQKFADGSADVQPGYAEDQIIPNPDWLSDQSNVARPPSPPPGAVPQGRGPTVYDRPKTKEEYYQAILPSSIPPNVKDYMYNTPTISLARGAAQVPGQGFGDTVPSMLTPGEAVLTPGAAQHVGRPKIAALNAMHPPARLSTFMPPVASGQATMAMRAGARGVKGALANTKLRPKMAGGLSGA